ncbi:hypothetical protein LTS10_007853 [Elasticomyces elasticus]|nr:hypothetical protein LTS10_007853 [Elasticomyces elasticus]
MQATRRDPSYNEYWRTSDFDRVPKSTLVFHVAKDGYSLLGPSVSKSNLISYAKRMERGRLCYLKCTDAEIQKFVKDRAIKVGALFRRDPYIAALDSTDRKQTFVRFVTLPPELRTLVYECYLEGLPKVLYNPVQPPLTRACRLLRKEALAMFYQRTTFVVRLVEPGESDTNILRLLDESSSFVLGSAVSNGGRVRSLRLEIKHRSWSAYRDFAMHVSFSRGGLGYVVSIPPYGTASSREDSELQARLQMVRGATIQLMQAMVDEKADKPTFEANDIYALRSAIERTWLGSSGPRERDRKEAQMSARDGPKC